MSDTVQDPRALHEAPLHGEPGFTSVGEGLCVPCGYGPPENVRRCTVSAGDVLPRGESKEGAAAPSLAVSIREVLRRGRKRNLPLLSGSFLPFLTPRKGAAGGSPGVNPVPCPRAVREAGPYTQKCGFTSVGDEQSLDRRTLPARRYVLGGPKPSGAVPGPRAEN